ncbi:MAG TPA: hypothetical protein VFB58_09425 [Chloroflexota bacterium]|nr:hypothetical protein [Chloroflexota bacterium]
MSLSPILQEILDSMNVPAIPGAVTSPYQNTLRVIGAVLDELEAHDVTVIEGNGNFTVRFETEGSIQVRETTHLELLEAFDTLQRDRTLLGSPDQGYYQDLLRAIGFEMERVGAHNLLLSEAGEYCLVSFQANDPTSVIWRKRHLVLDDKALAGILDTAHGRRTKSKLPFKLMNARRRPVDRSKEPEILKRFRDPESTDRMASTLRTQGFAHS